jgi:hypothetical protein
MGEAEDMLRQIVPSSNKYIWRCCHVVLVRVQVSSTRRCARKAAECGTDFVEKKASAWHGSQGHTFQVAFELNNQLNTYQYHPDHLIRYVSIIASLCSHRYHNFNMFCVCSLSIC